ncbi:MAG: hypothetical protein FWC39_05385 [Bacteroidetes bacterium]|nr:hypothetical protein [Bacteroidota bacterium]
MKDILRFTEVVLLFLLLGCNTNAQMFDYGRIENDVYYHSFFKMKISLPSGWIVKTQEQLQKQSERGAKIIAGNDEDMKALISTVDANDIKNANLLGISKYEQGAAVNFNPNLSLIAENVKDSPGIKTGGDYLFHLRKLLQQVQLPYSIDEEFERKVISNQEFYVLNSSLTYLGRNVTQIWYATIRDGFCLLFTLSFADDEQKNELTEIIKSIKFDK